MEVLQERQPIFEEQVEIRPRLSLPKKALIFLVAFFAISGIFAYSAPSVGDATAHGPERFSLFSAIRGLMPWQRGITRSDRVNVLLLGVGGAGHNGPELADTIIFASIEPKERRVGLLSIPRDLTVPIPGEGFRKVNAVNALAEANERGSGPAVTSEVLGDLLDQPIPYYVKIDFRGFARIIDDMGGIDVEVERSFQDPAYPVDENNVETLTFQKGRQHMDGDTALKFVRSRHGTNGEGSDFARSRRQQLVLLAVKNKMFSLSTFLNPARISRMLTTLEGHVFTNIPSADLIRLGTLLQGLEGEAIRHQVLDLSPGSPLYATSVNGAYVLLPKDNDWQPIRDMAEHLLDAPEASGAQTVSAPSSSSSSTPSSSSTTSSPPPRPTPEPESTQIRIPERPRVEIQNGTNRTGLAGRLSERIPETFELIRVGNAKDAPQPITVIYDASGGKYREELSALKTILHATRVQNTLPGQDVDFLVILGEDQPEESL